MNLADIKKKIQEFDDGLGWYQNIDLGDGIETKAGLNHPRQRWNEIAGAVPEDLSGMSVLDIGCNAGYISFEAKKRGADYVCGIDLRQEYIDQANFCAEVRGDDIDFKVLDVYNLDKLGREFDLVFFVGVLYHCKYLSSAIDQVSKVTNKRLIVESAIHNDDSSIPLVRYVRYSNYKNTRKEGEPILPGHWHPNMTALKDFFYVQGFENIEDIFVKGGRGAIVADR